MRKITLLFIVVFLFSFGMKGQELFFEDFNSYASSSEPEDWTILDEDGDGMTWAVIQFEDDMGTPSGDPALVSDSWNSMFGPLTPDNWAITPAIDLSEAEEEGIELSWKVTGVDPDYSDENYTVYVATENDINAFLDSDVTYNGLANEDGEGEGLENYATKTLDISSLEGETVYVAFRHHESTDVFRIAIDDVKVTAGELGLDKNHIEGFSHFYDANNKSLNLSAENALSGVQLYNLLGQEVLSENLSSTNETVNLSNLNAGVYLVKVGVEGNATSFKIAVK